MELILDNIQALINSIEHKVTCKKIKMSRVTLEWICQELRIEKRKEDKGWIYGIEIEFDHNIPDKKYKMIWSDGTETNHG